MANASTERQGALGAGHPPRKVHPVDRMMESAREFSCVALIYRGPKRIGAIRPEERQVAM